MAKQSEERAMHGAERAGRLAGKVALVTGASRGIGLGVARAFVSEGASVVLTDIRDELGERESASIASALLNGGGSRVVYQHLDVREERDWIAATDWTIATLGSLDVVVNNAGITGFGAGDLDGLGPEAIAGAHDPEHASLDAWRAIHATNLDGVFLGCKHAIRVMRAATGSVGERSGSIVNIGSRSGVVGISGAAAYASSKGAVRNHTKSVALYCAEQGLRIRCNVVQPAAILTPMWEPLLSPQGDATTPEERARAMESFVSDTPLRRFGTIDEVAALVVHLASDESAYTTGAEFTIDGGILAGSAATPRS
ncbi:MAG: SDR family oxidoreductase [Phycisphaeraceae bacterium]|nr:SDR family oxidoreductase [Phycisphaeraceae bacterium]